ncbi:MAG: hypothetical protein GY804_08260 [Alphaproteobacteria bacterium]|nr:hypothetical protein [Alphaproteobacteria bacterium]
MNKKKKLLSDEDESLWDDLTKDIKPIKTNAADIEQPSPRPSRLHAHSRKTPEFKTVLITKQEQALSHGETINIDKNTARKFKQGKMKIDARLDLHGMTQSQAHTALHDFIINNYHKQKRCLLVVTGKGKHIEPQHWSDRDTGVLKEMAPKWLNEPELRQMILSFSYATQSDGGEGALYVLLKRIRNTDI